MNKFELFNNLSEPVCIFSADNKIVYKNTQFVNTFPEFKPIEKFKKRFDFELYFFDAVNYEHQTPIDLMLASNENFHTVCTYRGENDEYRQYYIYSVPYIIFFLIDNNTLSISHKTCSFVKRMTLNPCCCNH